MANLTKAEMFSGRDRPVVNIEVPDLGDVGMRRMTETDYQAYIIRCAEVGKEMKPQPAGDEGGEADKPMDDVASGGWRGLKALLLVYCLVNPDGSPMFTVDDIDAINGLGHGTIDFLFEQAQRMNALDEDSRKEIEKNSVSSPGEDSSSS